MRFVAPYLQLELDKANPRVAFCWLIEPIDAAPERFTSWDTDLTVENAVYSSRAGLLPSAFNSGLGAGEADAIDITTLTDTDLVDAGANCVTTQRLLTGYYENAVCTIFIVAPGAINPTTPVPNVGAILLSGVLGGASRSDSTATFQLKPWSALFERSIGYSVKATCQCPRFGRGHCRNAIADGGTGDGIDIAARTVAGTVTQVLSKTQISVTLDGGASKPADWATAGIVRWTSPADNLYQPDRDDSGFAIKSWSAGGAIRLRLRLPFVPVVGQRIVVEEGCERTLGACSAKGNVVNMFMAFPHLPGQDAVVKRQTV